MNPKTRRKKNLNPKPRSSRLMAACSTLPAHKVARSHICMFDDYASCLMSLSFMTFYCSQEGFIKTLSKSITLPPLTPIVRIWTLIIIYPASPWCGAVWCLMSDVWCLMFDVWRSTFDVRRLMCDGCDGWPSTFDLRRFMFHVWCLMSAVLSTTWALPHPRLADGFIRGDIH
jgi:hypothetical protein